MSKKAPMITNGNQAYFAKMSVCGLQEEVNEANNMLGVVLDPPKPRIFAKRMHLKRIRKCLYLILKP